MQGSPMRRLKLHRWRRNICVVLGNIGTADDVPVLQQVLEGDDAMVAEHAQWALEQIAQR